MKKGIWVSAFLTLLLLSGCALKTCSDGTFYGACSRARFSYYCNLDGNLIKDDNKCSLENKIINVVYNTEPEKKCLWDTNSGDCAKNKPYYCEQGSLVEKASVCGCPEGMKINGKECVQIPGPEVLCNGKALLTVSSDSASYVNELLQSYPLSYNSLTAYLDIQSTEISESKENLIFKMTLKGNLDDLNKEVTYIWFLDTDNTISTGQRWPSEGVGNKYNLRVVHTINGEWEGYIDDIINKASSEAVGLHKQNSVYLIVPKARLKLNHTASIFYRAFSGANQGYGKLEHISFNSPSSTAPDMEVSPNEIFPGQLRVKEIYVSKSKPAEILYKINGIAVASSELQIEINNDPKIADINGSTITYASAKYSDINNFLQFGSYLPSADVFSEKFGIASKIKVLMGDLFLGNDVAFVLPGDFIPKNEGNPNVTGSLPWSELISKYDIVSISDKMYNIQKELVGIAPLDEPITYGFMYSANGLAGQPIGFGYVAIENSNNEPWWLGISHEMGHDFTGHVFFNDEDNFGEFAVQNSPRFMGLHKLYYSESFANLNALYAMHTLTSNPALYSVKEPALSSLEKEISNYENRFSIQDNNIDQPPGSLHDYKKRDSPFDKIAPDVVAGIFIKIADDNSINPYGWAVYKRFYKLFLPSSIDIGTVKEGQGETFFVASLSASTGTDLRQMFKKWNFPIDDNYYALIYSKLVQIISLESQVQTPSCSIKGLASQSIQEGQSAIVNISYSGFNAGTTLQDINCGASGIGHGILKCLYAIPTECTLSCGPYSTPGSYIISNLQVNNGT